jgi:hypothetical protein
VRKAPIILLVLAASLLLAPSATGAIRFAGPGGNGSEPCAEPANPCSIFRAADRAGDALPGDEVVLAPGVYSDAADDLGPNGSVLIPGGVEVHGAAGQTRPVIQLLRSSVFGAFTVEEGAKLSHVEIDSAIALANISVSGGTAEDVIARSSSNALGTTVCRHIDGLIRDSACISSGTDATALASRVNLAAPRTVRLRNVTAVATGDLSTGMSYTAFGNTSLDVSAKGVIARGGATDVFAAGLSTTPGMSGTGADVRIELDHSAYEDAGTRTDGGGGTASVTLPGTATNIMEPALLAEDGLHQLPGSPTLNTGAVDEFSSGLDIDGQPRDADAAPDIGADERLAEATVTTLVCRPDGVALGQVAVCSVNVLGSVGPPARASGEIEFVLGGPGSLGESDCVLAEASPIRSTCQVSYTPTEVGSGIHALTAIYPGDGFYDGSEASTAVSVTLLPPPPPPEVKPPAAMPPPVTVGPPAPPQTRLGKHPDANERKRLAIFTFSANPGGGRFECKLDDAPFKRCSSPYRATVDPGRHTFRVRAVSAAGVADPTPVSFSWKVARARR